MNIRCFLTRLRVKKIPVLNPARSLKNQLPHPLAPKDKAFPLPHTPLQQNSPHKKENRPQNVSRHPHTKPSNKSNSRAVSRSYQSKHETRLHSAHLIFIFQKIFKPLLLRLPFLRSHPIHSFIKPLQGLLLSLGHSLRNLNH